MIILIANFKRYYCQITSAKNTAKKLKTSFLPPDENHILIDFEIFFDHKINRIGANNDISARLKEAKKRGDSNFPQYYLSQKDRK
ncbi:MAG: hypothetical protein R3206_05720 [Salegentibacter mishustinae]|nr:hypothetical protein [Salegentibacter mishustinae]